MHAALKFYPGSNRHTDWVGSVESVFSWLVPLSRAGNAVVLLTQVFFRGENATLKSGGSDSGWFFFF